MPERKTVIYIQKEDSPDTVECWGSLKLACMNHQEFKYATIMRSKFPFDHQGWRFRRVNFNQKI
jgi:hypothetical protein